MTIDALDVYIRTMSLRDYCIVYIHMARASCVTYSAAMGMREASVFGIGDEYRFLRFLSIYFYANEGNPAAQSYNMKRLCFIFMWMIFACALASAHPINQYKCILLERQDEVPEDVEKRFLKEFTKMGFIVVDNDGYAELNSADKALTLTARYKLRGSAICLLVLHLVAPDGKVVYDDIQIGDSGFMSSKNDRQSALKLLFRELEKLNYHYEPGTTANSHQNN